jgi:zinc/manganese transport system substrate-binding protein
MFFKWSHCLSSNVKILFSILLMISFITGCTSAKGFKEAGKFKIVAAENFYGEVARAVGGNYVEVLSILNSPEMDPHEFEPTPQTSKDVHTAKIIIYNGAGYDEWMKKLIEASGDAANKTIITVASGVMGKKEGDNEHVWYNPETFPKYARDLAEKLGKLDSEHAAIYKKQAEEYIVSIAPLTALAQELKQTTPIPIAVSEPIFDYMAEALNLSIIDKKFKMAAEEGVDPAPIDVAQLQDDINHKKIKMFINNIQASNPTVENMVALARKNGIPIIEVTETLPKDKNYLQWMTDQLNQIKIALKQ